MAAMFTVVGSTSTDITNQAIAAKPADFNEIRPTPSGSDIHLSACWSSNLHGRLALIILCDQISRILYRGQK